MLYLGRKKAFPLIVDLTVLEWKEVQYFWSDSSGKGSLDELEEFIGGWKNIGQFRFCHVLITLPTQGDFQLICPFVPY